MSVCVWGKGLALEIATLCSSPVIRFDILRGSRVLPPAVMASFLLRKMGSVFIYQPDVVDTVGISSLWNTSALWSKMKMMEVLYLNQRGLDCKMEYFGTRSLVHSAKLSTSENLPEREFLWFQNTYQSKIQEVGSYSIKIHTFCSSNLNSIATSNHLTWSPKKTES